MYHKVLVPLDGSPLADMVLPHVIEIVRCTQAEVVLLRATPEAAGSARDWSDFESVLSAEVHAREVPHFDTTSVTAFGSGLPDEGRKIARQVEAAQGYLGGVAAELTGRGARVRTIVAPDHVAATILDVAEREGADLIAMSTHGRGGIGRFLLGSVADQVVHHANVPVLLVRAAAETAPRYRHILVPLDGSEVAHAVLPHVRQLAQCTGARVSLLQVLQPMTLSMYDPAVTRSWVGVSPSDATDPEDLAEDSKAARDRRQAAYMEEVAQAHLDAVAAELGHAGIEATGYVQVGSPAEAIVDFAKGEPIDLIAMSTHGRSGLQRFRMGSVADRVVRHAGAPVLVVRAMVAASGTAAA